MDALQDSSPNLPLIPTTDDPLCKSLKILRLISQWGSVADLCGYRLVCKAWNDQLISRDSCLPRRCVCMVTAFSCAEDFKGLTAGAGPCRYYRFECLDVENNLLRDPTVFQAFGLNHCPRLTCLEFDQCNLPSARFFEVIALCRNLKCLKIKKCTSIFEPTFGILQANFCYKALAANLAKLEQLSITDDKLSEGNLWGLAREMKSLKKIAIMVVSGMLPVYAIGKILLNNVSSLNKIILRGMVHVMTSSIEGLFPAALGEMKSLVHFSLQKANLLGTHVKMMDAFMGKCPSLKKLRLVEVLLNQTTFSEAALLANLKTVQLTNCSYTPNAFRWASFPALETLHLNQVERFGQNVTSAVGLLLGCPKPRLRHLELQLVHCSNLIVKRLDPNYCPNLASLTLTACIELAGPGLQHIFFSFPNLTILAITGCTEVVDASVSPVQTIDGVWIEESRSLRNLKNLVKLDLTKTPVGEKTVGTCVINNMSKLEELVLTGTKVEARVLSCLTNWAAMGHSSLKQVRAQHIIVSGQEWRKFGRIAPQLNVQCDIKT